jgi:hypothetical protein
LQPEQSAQQSAEEQHPVWAAFAVPASPSAITAINNITLNVFMVFSFRSGKSCSEAEQTPRGGPVYWLFFLNTEDVRL